jgi:hypothetical protein
LVGIEIRFQIKWYPSNCFAGLVVLGKNWDGSLVLWWCVNQAVVHAVNRWSYHEQDMMRLVSLLFLEAWFGFDLTKSPCSRE